MVLWIWLVSSKSIVGLSVDLVVNESVTMGALNLMYYLFGSGMSLSSLNYGNVGVSGKYGRLSSCVSVLVLLRMGWIFLELMIDIGMIGVLVFNVVCMNLLWPKCCSWYC